jgi:hypothetical protein
MSNSVVGYTLDRVYQFEVEASEIRTNDGNSSARSSGRCTLLEACLANTIIADNGWCKEEEQELTEQRKKHDLDRCGWL